MRGGIGFFRRFGHASTTVTPGVSNVSASNVSENGATISWAVDRAATGQVHYGTDTSYGSTTTEETELLTAHSQNLSGLTAGTIYHFKVVGEDVNGNAYDSGDFTFSTEDAGTPAFEYPSTIVTQQAIALQSYARPGVLSIANETTFGTELTRISNTAGARNAYASKAAWNADGSLLALLWYQMFRGSDFTALGNPAWGNKWTWSASDPTRAWAQASSSPTTVLRIYTVDTTTGAMTFVNHTLTSPNSGAYTDTDLGGGQGKASKDEKVSFLWQKSGSMGVAIWSAATSSVIWEKTITGSSSVGVIDHCNISWSGRYVMWSGTGAGTGQYQGMWVWDTVTNTGRQPQPAQAHADFSQDGAGNDWLCYRGSSSYHTHQGVWAMRASDGLKRSLIPGSGTNHGIGGIHISGTNYQRPGWAYVSDYNGEYSSACGGQIVAVNIDDPTQVEAFCQSHTIGPGSDYDRQPKAAAHPFGHQVVWGTKWESDATVFPYVAAVSL
jgi:hypothetical protein